MLQAFLDSINYPNMYCGEPTSTDDTKFYINGALNVATDTSFFSKCGTSKYGVFWLTNGTPFQDKNSQFYDNAAANGGVFNCEGCKMNLWKSTFQFN